MVVWMVDLMVSTQVVNSAERWVVWKGDGTVDSMADLMVSIEVAVSAVYSVE